MFEHVIVIGESCIPPESELERFGALAGGFPPCYRELMRELGVGCMNGEVAFFSPNQVFDETPRRRSGPVRKSLIELGLNPSSCWFIGSTSDRGEIVWDSESMMVYLVEWDLFEAGVFSIGNISEVRMLAGEKPHYFRDPLWYVSSLAEKRWFKLVSDEWPQEPKRVASKFSKP